ncbi:hypothetical protein ACFSRY_10130 [Pontibacter locisalis]|uniref:DKNYY family protein n=1 Tax=Pontibacter locisalis TaxID=1719035 RepID=A0ABW5IMN8_9BACT
MKIIHNYKTKLFGLADETGIIIEPCFETIDKVDEGYTCVKKNRWYKYLSKYGHSHTVSNYEYLKHKNDELGKVLFEEFYINEWIFLDYFGNQKPREKFAVLEPFSYGLAISAKIDSGYDKVVKGKADIMINEDGQIVFDRNEMRANILASNISYVHYNLSRISYNKVAVDGEFYRPGKAADSRENTYLWSYNIEGKCIK